MKKFKGKIQRTRLYTGYITYEIVCLLLFVGMQPCIITKLQLSTTTEILKKVRFIRPFLAYRILTIYCNILQYIYIYIFIENCCCENRIYLLRAQRPEKYIAIYSSTALLQSPLQY